MMSLEQNLDKDFDELKTGVKKLLGFNTFQYKDTYLGRRFQARMRCFHIDNYHDYWELLKRDEKEQEQLLKDLTINVTEFFRDNSVYQVFRDEILPTVIEEKNGKIRIWSAGSSDGKEAYSIAILATEILGERNAKDRIEIIGTDIDRTCLQRATSGVYESRPGIIQTDLKQQLSFSDLYNKYFDINNNCYKIMPQIKNLVKFEYHDLISGSKKKNFDIIFCRNVVIYFNRELQQILYMDFYNALNPNGFFVMGKTETLVGDARDHFISYNSKERIFRK